MESCKPSLWFFSNKFRAKLEWPRDLSISSLRHARTEDEGNPENLPKRERRGKHVIGKEKLDMHRKSIQEMEQACANLDIDLGYELSPELSSLGYEHM
jgi:hypothetical protein